MLGGHQHVLGYPVVAELKDQTSETAQSVVVCDRGADREFDRYAVWTVAEIGGRTEAWNGYYAADYTKALMTAVRRSVNGEL